MSYEHQMQTEQSIPAHLEMKSSKLLRVGVTAIAIGLAMASVAQAGPGGGNGGYDGYSCTSCR